MGSGLLVQALQAGLHRLSRLVAGCNPEGVDPVTPLLAVLVAAAVTAVIWMGWSAVHQLGKDLVAGSSAEAVAGVVLGLFLVLFLGYGFYILINNRTLERAFRLQELRRAAAERESWRASGGWLPAWEAFHDDLNCSNSEAFFLEWGGLLAAVEPLEDGAGYRWYVDLWALPVGVRNVPTLHAGFSRSESSAKRAAMRWLVVELRRPVDGLDEAEAVAQ